MGTVEIPVSWIVAAAIIIALFLVSRSLIPLRLWIEAASAGLTLPLPSLVGMRLRKSDAHTIVRGLIVGHRAGLDLEPTEVEALSLMGGDVRFVVEGMIVAKKSGREQSFKQAMEEYLKSPRGRADVASSPRPGE